MTTIVKCPSCGKDVAWTPENKFRPFCSERCKTLDFGDWVTGRNAISTPLTPEDFEKEEVIAAFTKAQEKQNTQNS